MRQQKKNVDNLVQTEDIQTQQKTPRQKSNKVNKRKTAMINMTKKQINEIPEINVNSIPVHITTTVKPFQPISQVTLISSNKQN